MRDFPTDPTRRMLLAALAASPLVAATKPAAAARPSSRVSETSIGAYVVGNPNAKLRLVEYFSYTCGACGAFAATGDAPLKAQYVDKGLVALEYRNLVRDPLDMTAALLARAGGAKAFPGHYRALMTSQSAWLVKATQLPEAAQKKWYEGDFGDRMARIARDTGLDRIMVARGVTAAQMNAALNSEVAQAALTAMTNLARGADKITSTPSFLLDGKLLTDAHNWPSVKSHLDRALRPA
jgi:hypothetical protein